MTERHPRNAPGDFYVVDGCCLACGVWEDVAKGLLEWDESGIGPGHCFVARQPKTESETDTMVAAMSTQEVDCMRYSGSDVATVRKLIAARQDRVCERDDILRAAYAEISADIGPRTWFGWLRFWRKR